MNEKYLFQCQITATDGDLLLAGHSPCPAGDCRGGRWSDVKEDEGGEAPQGSQRSPGSPL